MAKRSAGMGSIFRRGTNWYIRFKNEEGEYVKKVLVDPLTKEKCTTKGHADRVAASMMLEITTGGKVGLNYHSKATEQEQGIAELDEAYCEAFAGQWNDKRKGNRKAWMEKFINRFSTVASVTHESLGKYINERLATPSKKTGRKPTLATIYRELDEPRALLSWAEKTGRITKSPMENFSRKTLDNKREKILDKSEIKTLLSKLEDKKYKGIRLIVLIALFTAMRKGEILGLKWADLNERDKEIDILNPKNMKRRRIPVPASLWQELMEKKESSTSEFLFPSDSKDGHVGELKKGFKTLMDDCKITGAVFHSLRHTSISWMLFNGADAETVRGISGHSDLRIFSRYTSSLKEQKQAAVESLTKIFD